MVEVAFNRNSKLAQIFDCQMTCLLCKAICVGSNGSFSQPMMPSPSSPPWPIKAYGEMSKPGRKRRGQFLPSSFPKAKLVATDEQKPSPNGISNSSTSIPHLSRGSSNLHRSIQPRHTSPPPHTHTWIPPGALDGQFPNLTLLLLLNPPETTMLLVALLYNT